ncbi:transposase [Burkholderia pyrrocinia]|uniref:transposase n=1 Tax=Burkholderia pyrrocinia TaxID=60550 RepID=UPI00158BE6CB|nr:transposase [Burkholderia pyrrocinia]
MWLAQAELAVAPDTAPVRGRACIYSDAVIQALLGLKAVFRLPLRALQGFAQSQRDLPFAACRYQTTRRFAAARRRFRPQSPIIASGEPLHLIVDSTGLQVSAKANGRRVSAAMGPLGSAFYAVLVLGSRFTLHAFSPHSVTFIQSHFASLAVTSL